MLGLAVLYRYRPVAAAREMALGQRRQRVRGADLDRGSVAFSWYLSKFADYNATYGSLGAVIGLMMWMWISTPVVLIGAELNSEIEHQTARDSTAGDGEAARRARRGDGRHGRRGAELNLRNRPSSEGRQDGGLAAVGGPGLDLNQA